MVTINNISDCKRVVIKIGSSLVTNNSNDIDKKFLDSTFDTNWLGKEKFF